MCATALSVWLAEAVAGQHTGAFRGSPNATLSITSNGRGADDIDSYSLCHGIHWSLQPSGHFRRVHLGLVEAAHGRTRFVA